MITTDNKRLRQWRIRNSLFVVALISLAVLLGYLARENRIQWDVSQNARNSLSQASLAVLKELNGPLAVTVYATANDAQ
ncbi:MAG TPA: ABC transporter, partial [Nitrosospira sp.]